MKLSNNSQINLKKLIATRMLITANSGGGKSWLLRRLLEQSQGQIQQIVIDLEGEFGTLREKYDYLLVGRDGEIPAHIRTAGLLAKKLLELNVSTIIDLSELKHPERITFVGRFLDSLVNAPRELWHPALVVVDEAHQFCPETSRSESAQNVIDLMTRGRKRGFCGILATQRISKLSKDAAAEANNYLVGRCGLDVDMKRAGELLGFVSKTDTHSLRDLQAGEFYAFGAAFQHTGIKKIMVGEVNTTHPDRTRGVDFKKPLATPKSIKRLLKDITDLPREAEEELRTTAELKSKIRELRTKLTIAERGVKKENDPKALAHAEERGRQQSVGEIRQLKKALSALEAKLEKIGWILGQKVPRIEVPEVATALPAKVPIEIRRKIETSGVIESFNSGPEQRILNAIAWLESIGVNEPEQTAVAFLAGYSFGGGGFNNPKGSLRKKGLVEYRGRNIAITEQGRAVAKIPEETLTQEELHRKVLSVLPTPEQRLLKPLLERYPEPISNEELAELSGYAAGSGGFNNPRGRLRTLGLVEYSPAGHVRARNILFLE